MKILVWKDCKVGLRSVGILIVFITLVGYLPILWIVGEQIKAIDNDPIMLALYLKTSILFLPAMQIPMIGTLVFQTTLNEDRKNKALQVLVADGTQPNRIWSAKLMASLIIAYGLSCISLLIALVFSRILFRLWIPFDFESLLMVILIVPIISFSFLSIIGTIMWSSRQGQALAGLLPVFSYIGCMYFNMYLADKNMLIHLGLLILLFVISALIFFINIILVKHLNNEYIINIQT